MKQYISIEQLNELSEKGKKRLRGWWYPKNIHVYDLYWPGESNEVETIGCCEDEVSVGAELPLLSIGQMIEFLGDHTDGIYSYPVIENDGGKYLTSQYIDGNEIETLCDWLWDAVKEILEK